MYRLLDAVYLMALLLLSPWLLWRRWRTGRYRYELGDKLRGLSRSISGDLRTLHGHGEHDGWPIWQAGSRISRNALQDGCRSSDHLDDLLQTGDTIVSEGIIVLCIDVSELKSDSTGLG